MYTTLLFDSDDTLLDFKKSEAHALEQAFCTAGLKFSDGIANAYPDINKGLWKRLEKGEINADELTVMRFEILFSRFGIDFDASRFNDIYYNSLAGAAYLIEGAQDVLAALFGKYEMCVITNGFPYIQKSRLEKSGLKKYFSEIFISGEIGASKPSLKFFEHVLSHIHEKDKSKILVIGDSITSDIQGAQNAGLDSAWIAGSAKEDISAPAPTYKLKDLCELISLLENNKTDG